MGEKKIEDSISSDFIFESEYVLIHSEEPGHWYNIFKK